MNSKKCPICESDSENLGEIEGYMEGEFFRINSCKKCDLNFVDFNENLNVSKVYDNIYLNSSVVQGYNRYSYYKETIKTFKNPLAFLAESEPIYWSILNCLETGIIESKSSILEVGCGMGYLTYSLNKIGYEIIGMDISQEAIKEARNMFGDLYFSDDVVGLSNRSTQRYDVIILTEVIEHLMNPFLFMDELMKLLNDGGKIIVTTPNKNFIKNNTNIWDSDLPPVHFWWFSEKSLKLFLHKLGLSVFFINFTNYNIKQVNYQLKSNPPKKPILNKLGKVIEPMTFKPNTVRGLKRLIKKVLLFLNKNNLNESQTISAIITKYS